MKRSHVLLAILVCAMYAGAIFGLFKLEPPAGAREPLLILIGGLSAAFGAIIQYAFGSSMGSAEKNSLLREKRDAVGP